jgi:imidazolonepropionase-like amidohydrolase
MTSVFKLLVLVVLRAAQHSAADPLEVVFIHNAEYVTEAGQPATRGCILIQEGRIQTIGEDCQPPPGAALIDAAGLLVYPGFIDAASPLGLPAMREDEAELLRLADDNADVRDSPPSATAEGHRRLMHPQRQVHTLYAPDDKALQSARSAGFTTALIAPRSGICAGRSAVLQLGSDPRRRSILDPDFAQHGELSAPARGDADDGQRTPRYPSTTMGAVAAWRQLFLDASWHRDLQDWWRRHPEAERVPVDPDLESLTAVLDRKQPVILVARREQDIHRALDVAAELGVRPIIAGADEGWRVVQRLQTEAAGVILGLGWPEEPVRKPGRRPAQPAPILFDEYWESLPYEPERVLEERRRRWHELVDNARILAENHVAFAVGSFAQIDAGDDAPLPRFQDLIKNLRQSIGRGLPEETALAALTSHAGRLLGRPAELGRIAPGALGNLTAMTGPLGNDKSRVAWVLIEGRQYFAESPPAEGSRQEPGQPSAPGETAASTQATADQDQSAPSPPVESAEAAPAPEFASEIEADRIPNLRTGGRVLLRGATLLTVSGDDLQGLDLLVEGGRIAKIGRNLTVPAETASLDLTGYYVSPGLIDCHSHMCSMGGLNEATLSVTCEVRVGDVIDHRDLAAYRALAGGVTTIHTMHGSANTIGGQNVVLKLKYGRPPDEWRFPQAARTVKFALGENVKQSNFGVKGTRFPNTRMGVEAVLQHAFDAARTYAGEWQRLQSERAAGGDPRPLRRDLRLEALSEVLAGDLWVHCHCYRADEVLRLLAIAEDYGFRIGVLQHILEGYRIIPEIHRHGCGTSTFSDWWSYKLEAAEAVPHNAARLVQGGVLTTVNSDSAEVIRHLNLEAAKSLRFGGLSARQSLALVTLSAARQLGVDSEVGSLEVGKAADLAVFDRHPLDTFSKCVLTLIDGEVYFQHREFDPASPQPPPATSAGAEHAIDASGASVAAFNRGTAGGKAFPRDVLLSLGEPLVDPASGGDFLLVGATVHPISGPAVANGEVEIRDGLIHWIGPARPGQHPSGAQVIDCRGLHVYPGLINAGTSLGLTEIGSVAGSVDEADIARFQPELLALSAYNPFSAAIDVTRCEGVTTALVTPGSRGPQAPGSEPRPSFVAGRAGLVQLQGWTMPEATRQPVVALMVNLPSLPVEYPRRQSKKEREEQDKRRAEHRRNVLELQKFWERARRYADADVVRRAPRPGEVPFDRRMESMRPFVLGERPVLLSANDYKEIVEAVEFARRYGLRAVIHGGREAWKLADRLAADHVDVIIERATAYPGGEFEPWDSVYRNATVLAGSEVRFCFATGGASLAKQLGIEAGLAVAHGLDPDRAIRALTLDAAAVLGLDDRLGSLDPGKVADVIVTTGSPLQASTYVVAEFIAGRPVDLTSKHTLNDAKFVARPAPRLPAEADLRGPPAMELDTGPALDKRAAP